MFECRLNQFVVEILQEYNAALGLNNPPPTAQLLNAMASFVKQNTIKSLNLSVDEDSATVKARAEFNDGKFTESVVDISFLKYELDAYELAKNLEGSDTVVVDVNEAVNKVEIHLDSEVVAKIDRALLMPLSAPTELELVAINEQKEQVRVKLGEGVVYNAETQTIENSKKLYRHMVSFGSVLEGDGDRPTYITVSFLTTDNTLFTDNGIDAVEAMKRIINSGSFTCYSDILDGYINPYLIVDESPETVTLWCFKLGGTPYSFKFEHYNTNSDAYIEDEEIAEL